MATGRGAAASALEEDYLAIRSDVGATWIDRDVVSVRGPDAPKFLQGQLSQDVSGAPGTSAWSYLLQPQGKVVALLRVSRRRDDEFVLDTDAGWGSAVIERLERFKLRIRCEVTPLSWRCLGIRGPRAHEVADGLETSDGVFVGAADWPGMAGVDLVGPAPDLPAGIRLCDAEAFEAVRIESGVPAMGHELDERTIPAEAGVIDQTVSFTKGCYTGQELVARIDSRGGNVPRRLRGVVIGPGSARPPAGAVIRTDEREAGSLTSVGPSIGSRGVCALAYIRRQVEPPVDAVVDWDGGSAAARVCALPLVP